MFDSVIKEHCTDILERDAAQRSKIEEATSFPAMEAVFQGTSLAIAGMNLLSAFNRNRRSPQTQLLPHELAEFGRVEMLRVASLNALDERTEYELSTRCRETIGAMLAERHVTVPRVRHARRPVLRSQPIYVALTQNRNAAEDREAEERARMERQVRRQQIDRLKPRLDAYHRAKDWAGVLTILAMITEIDDEAGTRAPYATLTEEAHKRLSTRVTTPLWKLQAGAHSAAWHPDGSRIIVTDAGRVRIFDLSGAAPREESAFKAAKAWIAVKAVAVSPDGARVATVSDLGVTRIWNASTGMQILKVHPDSPYNNSTGTVAFSPDGALIATTSKYPQGALICDARTGDRKTWIGFDKEPWAIALSPDGTCLAGAADNHVCVWDIANQNLRVKLPHDGPARAVAFSPKGTLLATADGHNVYLWDFVTGRSELKIPHDTEVPCVAFSPNGTLLATAGYFARVWEVGTGRLVAVHHEAHVLEVAFSPDGQHLATVAGPVCIWTV